MIFTDDLLTGAEHPAFSTNHLTDISIDKTKQKQMALKRGVQAFNALHYSFSGPHEALHWKPNLKSTQPATKTNNH